MKESKRLDLSKRTAIVMTRRFPRRSIPESLSTMWLRIQYLASPAGRAQRNKLMACSYYRAAATLKNGSSMEAALVMQYGYFDRHMLGIPPSDHTKHRQAVIAALHEFDDLAELLSGAKRRCVTSSMRMVRGAHTVHSLAGVGCCCQAAAGRLTLCG